MTAPPADTTLVEVDATPAPGPGQRVARAGGQTGAASIGLQLVIAFGWWGADTWTPEQTAAATAAAIFAVGAAHNLYNWWTSRQRLETPPAV